MISRRAKAVNLCGSVDYSAGYCYDLSMDSLKQVLVIDDDRDVLRVLQLALEQAGHKTIIAVGTGEAQEMLRIFRFDLVLCDLTMPGENGNNFKDRMAQIYPELPPFIFCSGMVHEFPVPPYAAGVAGYLSKPFSLKTLLNAVEEALKSRDSFMPFIDLSVDLAPTL